MTLTLHVYCGYPVLPHFYEKYEKPSKSEFASCNLVRVAKGEETRMFGWVPDTNGRNIKIESGERDKAIHLFGRWGAHRLKSLGLNDIALVPVPSSSQITFGGDCTGLRLAEAIASYHSGAQVTHTLAFREARLSDHKKRAQDGQPKPPRQSQDEILANLKCNAAKFSKPLVLVDDVYTMGRHMKACAEYLRDRGATVEHCLCIGQTIWERVPDTFTIEPFDIEQNPFADFAFLEEYP